MAITDLVTEQWRLNADLFRKIEPRERGNDLDSMRRILWDDIRAQLLNRQLVARGIPDGSRISERIDPHFFSEATVDFREGSVTLGSSKFVGVRIKRAQQEAASEGATTTSTITPESWWMLSATASDQPTTKRAVAIPQCCKEVGCTWREAETAWNALPPERRGNRGKPKKSSK